MKIYKENLILHPLHSNWTQRGGGGDPEGGRGVTMQPIKNFEKKINSM